MNIEHLPSQLHLSFHSDVDLEILLQNVENFFPNAEKVEIRNDTLYIYKANEDIEYIHLSQHKLGVIFSPEVVTTGNIDSAWSSVETLISKLKVSKLSKFDWQVKIVHPFKSKTERDSASIMLSPFDGYKASTLTLHPKKKSNYSVGLNMVNKDKKQYGILVKFTYKINSIYKKDVPLKLMQLRNEFVDSNEAKSMVNRFISA